MDINEDFIIKLFLKLRVQELNIGVKELQDALNLIRSAPKNKEQELQKSLSLMWCSSTEEAHNFDIYWKLLTKELKTENKSKKLENIEKIQISEEKQPETEIDKKTHRHQEIESCAIETTKPYKQKFSPLPILSPQKKQFVFLNTYTPLPKQFMSYGWRNFMNTAVGKEVEMLDLEKTIDNSTKQGFFLFPVYKKSFHNFSQLIILLDVNGSMTPFHHLGRDLIETAMSEFPSGKIRSFYFHNLMSDYLYSDEFLSEKIEFERALENIGIDTGILIFSDAGSARGHRSIHRINWTKEFLDQLRQITAFIGWLNPMPRERWNNTSAESISEFVYMFQMDIDGFSNTIDVLRGRHSSGK